MSVLTAEQFWETLSHCCGYPKCDGDLVATEHSEECPLHGKKELTLFEFANAYAADLTKRLEASEARVPDLDMQKIRIQELATECANWETKYAELYNENCADVSELSKVKRQLTELREPMACGHPKVCWVEAHCVCLLDQMDNSTCAHLRKHTPHCVIESHCTACARENAQIAAVYRVASKHWPNQYGYDVSVHCSCGWVSAPPSVANTRPPIHVKANEQWQEHIRSLDADAKAAQDVLIASAEVKGRLAERKLAAFHEFNENCTCFHCKRIADLEKQKAKTEVK